MSLFLVEDTTLVLFSDNPPHSIRGSDKLSEKGSSSTPAETLPEAGAASEGGSTADVGGGGDGSDLPSELPFQLQITYTDIDGMKALRVLTQKKPVTNDRNVAEKGLFMEMALAVHHFFIKCNCLFCWLLASV